MQDPQELSKRWSITRELTNEGNEEIATMVQQISREMYGNGLAVEYISVYIDTQHSQYTRIIILLRLDQWVTERTVFYWLGGERAIIKSLKFQDLRNKKRMLRKSNKICLFKWGVEDIEAMPIPENIAHEW